MFLDPAQLARLTRYERTDELQALDLFSCFECAACSYVCPSGIPLVQYHRMGKAMVKAAGAKS